MQLRKVRIDVVNGVSGAEMTLLGNDWLIVEKSSWACWLSDSNAIKLPKETETFAVLKLSNLDVKLSFFLPN